MAHPLNLISHDPRIAKEQHFHRCPICKRFKYESNEVCQKVGRDHTFACMTCMNDWRCRFGIDALTDVGLSVAGNWRGRMVNNPTQRFIPEQVQAIKMDQDEVRERSRNMGPGLQLLPHTQAVKFMQVWKSTEQENQELLWSKRTNNDILSGEPLKGGNKRHPAS